MRTALALALLAASAAHAAEPHRLVLSPERPTEADAIRVTVLGSDGCAPYFTEYSDVPLPRIHLNGFRITTPCEEGPWTAEARIQTPLAPGTYTVEATLDGSPYATADLVVESSPTEVVLGQPGAYFGSSFRLELEWVDPRTGERHLAGAVQHSNEAAHFWFFSPGNVEVTVKILDGRPINAHWWLFLASMTTVEFTLRVEHCVDGDPPFCLPTQEFRSAAGENRDLVDLEAF